MHGPLSPLRRRQILFVGLTFALLGLVGPTSARQTPPATRTWRDVTGQHTIVAELLDLREGTVRLKTEQGRIISLELEKLSPADRRFVEAATSAGEDDGGTAAEPNVPETSEFAAARRSLLAEMKTRDTARRVAAIRRFGDFPLVDSAETVVSQGLSDRDEEVRRAAYETLLGLNAREEICAALLRMLGERASRQGEELVAGALLAVLLDAQLPQVERAVLEFVDGSLASSAGGVELVAGVAEALGQQGDEPAAVALERLTRSRLFANRFAARRVIVHALTRIRRPRAVDILIRVLSELRGEVRGDIATYLAKLSGENHGVDAPAWLAWWNGNREGFQFPFQVSPGVQAAAAAFEGFVPEGTPGYYGMPIYAQRLVFVLDVSGSMQGGRLQAAKRELIEAINGLTPATSFGIIAYNTEITVWRPQLTPATPGAKLDASQCVMALTAGSSTASYDALEAAFEFDVEAIYFLSDGKPTAGKVVNPAQIVAFIGKINHARLVSVYTVGIAPGLPGSTFDVFLRTLAERNMGVYQRVDR